MTSDDHHFENVASYRKFDSVIRNPATFYLAANGVLGFSGVSPQHEEDQDE